MFKNIISPVQAWLISQGRCAGCGVPLKGPNLKLTASKIEDEELLTCKCGRVYVHDKKNNKYRRALLSEI